MLLTEKLNLAPGAAISSVYSEIKHTKAILSGVKSQKKKKEKKKPTSDPVFGNEREESVGQTAL